MQDELKPYIVPAILDHDEISRGKSQAGGLRGRAHSQGVIGKSPGGDAKRISTTIVAEPKSLVNHLDRVYQHFQHLGLDGAYIEQIYMQLMHYVCVIALNNLMLRQELCNWKTGMQIRYNVSCLEEWVRKKNMVSESRLQTQCSQTNNIYIYFINGFLLLFIRMTLL